MTKLFSVSQFLQKLFANGQTIKNSGFTRGDRIPFEVKEAIDRDLASAAEAVAWVEEVESEFRQGMRLALLANNQLVQDNPELAHAKLDRSNFSDAMEEGYNAVVCC